MIICITSLTPAQCKNVWATSVGWFSGLFSFDRLITIVFFYCAFSPQRLEWYVHIFPFLHIENYDYHATRINSKLSQLALTDESLTFFSL